MAKIINNGENVGSKIRCGCMLIKVFKIKFSHQITIVSNAGSKIKTGG